MPTLRDTRQTVGEENILDAAYLVVNRLASKCIQRLDLKGIAQAVAESFPGNAWQQRNFPRPGI
jgi:hypothetical protein